MSGGHRDGPRQGDDLDDDLEGVAGAADAAGTEHRLEVGPGDAGARLDRFCASHIPQVSRSRLAELVREGIVLVDGAPARPSLRLEPGSVVELRVLARVEPVLLPEDITLAIVYEDEDVIVLDKPAGLVVHPGAGVTGGTLAAALLHHDPAIAGVGGPGRAGIVHRLDQGTTGVMVAARNERAHRALQEQFRARTVDKLYHAIVWGRPRAAEGRIDRPIARDPSRRVKMSTRVPGGRAAESHYRVIETVPAFAFVEVRIRTGRTHQVRVHLAAIGHPVVGDALYGGARAASIADPARRRAVLAIDRPLLHAARLAFDQPRTGARLAFEVPWAGDMVRAWRALGGTRP